MTLPLITAHAGCENTPANTVESVIAGHGWGADINEVDVRATRDGVPVLWHDEIMTLEGMGDIPFNNLEWSEILDYQKKNLIIKPHSRWKMTAVEELFDALRGTDIRLNLDLKDDACIPGLIKILDQKIPREQIVFSGCKDERAAFIRKNYPSHLALLNVEETFMDRTDLTEKEKVEQICDLAITLGCCGLNIDKTYCTPFLVEYTARRFLPVAVWTVKPEEFDHYINMGVHSITTVDVKKLYARRNSRLS